MPIWHIIDQHAFRGVAHPLRGGGESFSERFQTIFNKCTGFNPRNASLEACINDPLVPHIRFAQECCFRFAVKSLPRKLQLDTRGGVAVAARISIALCCVRGECCEMFVMSSLLAKVSWS